MKDLYHIYCNDLKGKVIGSLLLAVHLGEYGLSVYKRYDETADVRQAPFVFVLATLSVGTTYLLLQTQKKHVLQAQQQSKLEEALKQ